MFELSIALKYLIPRRKQLSVSLIALLSVAVISLVVWLVLVFLSVTEGIERNWLQKLTTLNAPLRITPTQHYYSSYYYHIDEVSSNSGYTVKNIAEKIQAQNSDPYSPLEDGELPAHFPKPDLGGDTTLKDPVKGLYATLSKLKQNRADLVYQDFEISGALLRLQMLRPGNGLTDEKTQSYLTQVSYLASFPDHCPGLHSLLLSPREQDLNHLINLSAHSTELSRQDSPALTQKTDQETAQKRIRKLLSQVVIKELKPHYPLWQFPSSLLPENQILKAAAIYRSGKLIRIEIPTEGTVENPINLWKENDQLFIGNHPNDKEKIPQNTPLLSHGQLLLHVEGVSARNPVVFKIKTALQGVSLRGEVPLRGLEIAKADFNTKNKSPILSVNEEKETEVLLAKSYLDSGVMIGDRGYLSYSSSTSSSLQEHRLPIFVAGFYDPGILSVGNKCILVPPSVTQAINSSSSSFNLDKTQANGILVWFDNLKNTEEIKQQILTALTEQGLDKYWQLTTFRQYDFAKDLMEQFQSDKYLFALVGIIILVVACCNIISMLVLLVNDKRREIGILQAMGASHFSIASIFGTCGVMMGVLSSIIGTIGALFTLKYIDSIVRMLSFFQGHDAFNTAFFGQSLPNALSEDALTFIVITTPIISLLAGLIPAIKACRLRPSEILRAE